MADIMSNMNEDRAQIIKNCAKSIGWTSGMVLMYALCMGIKGKLIKEFKNGQELREYDIGEWRGKIRAYPVEHSA